MNAEKQSIDRESQIRRLQQYKELMEEQKKKNRGDGQ